jgi:large subunit ribosomal protein L9e
VQELASVRTVCSHITNMMLGVTVGFLYKMRAVYAHFPINLTLGDGNNGKNSAIDIRNYLGEKVIRTIHAHKGVSLLLSKDVKDEIQISGSEIEAVSLTAARIQGSCKCPDKDIRKFLDGIYVSEKTNIVLDL